MKWPTHREAIASAVAVIFFALVYAAGLLTIIDRLPPGKASYALIGILTILCCGAMFGALWNEEES